MQIEILAEIEGHVTAGYAIEARKDIITLTKGSDRIEFGFHPNGNLRRRTFTFNLFEEGYLLHRPCEEGPACEVWNEDGLLIERQFSKFGNDHRPAEQGPSYESWYDDGSPRVLLFSEDGRQHRPVDKGPSYQSWNIAGGLEDCEYWEFGRQVSPFCLPRKG